MWRTQFALLIPAIIDAWFFASENTCQGLSGPAGLLLRMVPSVAWLETNPEVNSSAAALPCSAASSASSAT